MTYVLDTVDYRTLQCGQDDKSTITPSTARSDQSTPPPTTTYEVNTLQVHSCTAFFRGILHTKPPYSEKLLKLIENLPQIMLYTLMYQALLQEDGAAIEFLIALWPRDTLRLRDILPSRKFKLSETIGNHMLRGFGQLHASSKLQCLDLEGTDLDHTSTFYNQMVFALPVLSVPLPKDLKHLQLMNMIDDILDNLVKEGRVTESPIGRMHYKKILIRLIAGTRRNGLGALEGRRLVVLLDRLVFYGPDRRDDFCMLMILKDRITVTIRAKQFTFYDCPLRKQSSCDFIQILQDGFEKMPQFACVKLVEVLKRMPSLHVLNLEGWPVDPMAVNEMCIVAKAHLSSLKMVKLSFPIAGSASEVTDDHRKVTQAFASIPSLQEMCLVEDEVDTEQMLTGLEGFTHLSIVHQPYNF